MSSVSVTPASRGSQCFVIRYGAVLLLCTCMVITVGILCVVMFVARFDMRARCFGAQYDPDMFCVHERRVDRDVRLAAGWLTFLAPLPIWYLYAMRGLFRQAITQRYAQEHEQHRRTWILESLVESRLQNALYEMASNPGRAKYQHVFVDDKIVTDNFDLAARIAARNYVKLYHDEQGNIVADIIV